MPVIVSAKSPHPFLPSLGDPVAIEAERARHQDIRPLEVAIINLMADKPATERQLATWLGNTVLQVNLTFAATDEYVRGIHAGRESKNTSAEHIRNFYNAWSDIKHRAFDGLVLTGVNALEATVEAEVIWPDVQRILDWSTTNVFSSLFLCWGAKAALKHFHDIDSFRGKQKTFGLFDHHIVSDKTNILFGFPDVFAVPIARWKSPRKADILKHPEIEILAEVNEIGPEMMAESRVSKGGGELYPHRLYVLNHPEYETETLKMEYDRDHGNNPDVPLPKNYFTNDDPTQPPRNTWRHTAHFYTNWIKAIYETTPYNIVEIPVASRRRVA